MSVWTKDPNKYWTKGIPYVLVEGSSYSGTFKKSDLVAKIEEFNRTVGKTIFYPRDNEADYVEFKYPGANSPIGKQGGKQQLGYDENNMFHEMGHCIGMGHQHLYALWPISKFLQGVNKDEWEVNQFTYKFDNKYDNTSVMCYPLDAFQQSPSIIAALEGKTIAKQNNPKTQKSTKRSSLGGKAQASDPIPTTEQDVAKIKACKRDPSSNDMKLSVDDIARIELLCPEAADVE
jgi:hypothetical protein